MSPACFCLFKFQFLFFISLSISEVEQIVLGGYTVLLAKLLGPETRRITRPLSFNADVMCVLGFFLTDNPTFHRFC